MVKNIKLTWVDSWLLLSILYSLKNDRTFELKNVIRMGDVINHAIFTYQEINVGIERLILTGFLLFDTNKIFISEKSIKILKIIETREGEASPLMRLQQLDKELEVLPYGTVPGGVNYGVNSINYKEYISEEEYQNAFRSKATELFLKILKLLQFDKGNKDK